MLIPLEFINLAHKLADASAEITKKYFRQPMLIEDKADASPVSLADKQAEQVMRELIWQNYPQHGIYGEEFGLFQSPAEFVWVLDPIDGTKSFITGKPLFTTLIALLHNGKPILGLIDQAITSERWLGGLGLGSSFNGQNIQVRSCNNLNQAILYATSPDMFFGSDYKKFNQLKQQVKYCLYGADAYAYALLAMGLVDLVVEADLSAYDYCAQVPLITQAGGIITDWQGAALGLDSDGRVIAAGDANLHQQLVKLLQ
jgi:inositol-phosphate phosphatase / L-galactose 1-phosphate phosphatase / histidinol-phosphatase